MTSERRTGRRASGGEGPRPSPYPRALERLIEEFARLPGIGRRSAERMAFHVLVHDGEAAQRLAGAVLQVKRAVRPCPVCFNLTDEPGDAVCGICADPRRDAGQILVVEQPRDLIGLEQTGMYRGVYHVLMGHISPLDGVGPGDLTIDALLRRVERPETNPRATRVREVILGLNPTIEGDGTGLYLADELHRRGVRVTRLARGLPSGSSLELASKAVLADALECRQEVG